jgi:isoamyl acetate esterase
MSGIRSQETRRQISVALIGDSIRLHAEPWIKVRLPPRYRVRSPAENCRSSWHVLAGIRNWVPPGVMDVVHINCGLHDIRRDPGQDQPISSPREYVANLRRTFEYLAHAATSVIWATSTPVSENFPNDLAKSRWHTDDLVAYNRASVDLALGFGFRINDLHARLSLAPADALLMSDGVHFNDAGNRLIGAHVSAAIQGRDA